MCLIGKCLEIHKLEGSKAKILLFNDAKKSKTLNEWVVNDIKNIKLYAEKDDEGSYPPYLAILDPNFSEVTYKANDQKNFKVVLNKAIKGEKIDSIRIIYE